MRNYISNVRQRLLYIEHSERKAINARGVWQIISCHSTNGFELGKRKSYPELQILVSISDQFDISLDTLLKEDSKMVQSIDKERVMGIIKREKSVVDFFTGAGTGIIVSCLFSPDSSLRTAVIIVGIIMVCIGWYKKSKSDKKISRYIEEHD